MDLVNPIQIEKFLKGVNYPATKQDLVRAAEKNGGNEDVKRTLEKMPGHTFDSPKDVSEAIGKIE
ncbi:MAG: DUF2795 domain-containing protein [Thermomicrobiales bacterium]|nr:DUF2795 domain-containing protein [Thermomicrobiales bacterium]